MLCSEHLESIYGWSEACVHLIAAKQVLRYLKCTIDYGLRYVVDCEFGLVGYTDSDRADSVTDRKSTSGCCFSLGSAVIAWRSRKQTSVALSTAKARVYGHLFNM